MTQSVDAEALRAQLRQWARGRLTGLPLDILSEGICRQLARWPLFQKTQVVAAYAARPFEIDLRPLVMAHPEKLWLFPRIAGKDTLHFHRVQPERRRAWATHAQYGIAEPAATAPRWRPWEPGPDTINTPIDLMIVPGLFYTVEGDRLGSGKGYYDRFLATYGKRIQATAGLLPEVMLGPASLPVLARLCEGTHEATEAQEAALLAALAGNAREAEALRTVTLAQVLRGPFDVPVQYVASEQRVTACQQLGQ